MKQLLQTSLSLIKLFDWHKAFSECCKVIENSAHAGRPFNSVNDVRSEKVKETIAENPHVGYTERAGMIDSTFFVNVLGMKRISAKLVPKA